MTDRRIAYLQLRAEREAAAGDAAAAARARLDELRRSQTPAPRLSLPLQPQPQPQAAAAGAGAPLAAPPATASGAVDTRPAASWPRAMPLPESAEARAARAQTTQSAFEAALGEAMAHRPSERAASVDIGFTQFDRE